VESSGCSPGAEGNDWGLSATRAAATDLVMDALEKNDEQSWAAALAARLRLIQSSGQRDSVQIRQDHLAEEIEGALKGVALAQRPVYLGALTELFPSWQVPAPTGGATDVMPGTEDETPEGLLKRFVAMLPCFTAEQKQSVALALGLEAPVSAGGMGPALDLSGGLPEVLGGDASDKLDSERLALCLSSLLALLIQLDQPLWYTWKQLAPRSPNRPAIGSAPDLKSALRGFLAGIHGVTAEELLEGLDLRRSLLAGLLAAVGGAPQIYARRYLERLSPEAIRETVEMQKRSPWRSFDVGCWEKFVELSKEYGSEGAIEKAIRDAITRFTEQVMKGRLSDSEA